MGFLHDMGGVTTPMILYLFMYILLATTFCNVKKSFLKFHLKQAASFNKLLSGTTCQNFHQPAVPEFLGATPHILQITSHTPSCPARSAGSASCSCNDVLYLLVRYTGCIMFTSQVHRMYYTTSHVHRMYCIYRSRARM